MKLVILQAAIAAKLFFFSPEAILPDINTAAAEKNRSRAEHRNLSSTQLEEKHAVSLVVAKYPS